jgi:hypothetical protein
VVDNLERMEEKVVEACFQGGDFNLGTALKDQGKVRKP